MNNFKKLYIHWRKYLEIILLQLYFHVTANEFTLKTGGSRSRHFLGLVDLFNILCFKYTNIQAYFKYIYKLQHEGGKQLINQSARSYVYQRSKLLFK